MSSLTKNNNVLLGAFCMIMGMFFFGITNAVAKGTGNDLPLSEIIFFRSLISSLCMFLYAKFKGNSSLRTKEPGKQIFRGFLGFWQLFFLYWSFAVLPMADATAISFATTLFVTAFSAPFLKQRVGPARWAATLIGFIGVLVVSKPSGMLVFNGAAAALLAAFLEAMVMLYACKLGKEDSAFTTVFYYTLTTCIIGGIIAPFVWVTPTFDQISLITLLGFAGTLGHIFIARSYQLAPAAVVAPMFYTLLVWGIIFGYAFWREIPSLTVMIGACIIIACGLFIVYREHRLGKTPKAS